MAKKMAVGPDDLRQLTCLGAADYGKLDRLVMLLQELGDAGTVGDRIDMHVGIALLPLLHLALKAVALAEHEYRRLPELRFLDCEFDHGLIVVSVVGAYDDPVDRIARFILVRPDNGDRAVSVLGELGCRRTQNGSGVLPDSDRTDADHRGVTGFCYECRAGWAVQHFGFDFDRPSSGLNCSLRHPK
jgi:hypothetical protein